MSVIKPDYKRIFKDMISHKYPHKLQISTAYLEKEELSDFDILQLSELLSESKNKEDIEFNQKHKSYNIESVKAILKYQEENKLNNTQTVIHFKMSKNTLKKWRNAFG